MTEITNDTATEDTGNRYNVCQRTGVRVLPGTLVREWTGLMVRRESLDIRSQQDLLRAKSENQHGSIRPEPSTDQFISDLYPDGVSTDDI